MFSLPGTIALIVFFLVRVQEIVPALHAITVSHLMILGFVGLAIDVRLGRVQLPRSGFAKACYFFMGWSFLLSATTQIRTGFDANGLIRLASAYCLFFLIGLGAQSLRAIRVVMWVIVASIMFATVVAVEQGTQPLTCVVTAPDGSLKPAPGPTQYCERRHECQAGSQMEADVEFQCESVGWVGTASVFGRVRYRGLLEDPNELAWVATMIFPLVLWLVNGWVPVFKYSTILVVFALDAACVIMTKSRSGQLSFLIVIAALTWRRLGVRGLLAAAMLGLPVALLGGRGGEDAESSSMERLECWQAGITMWREHPIFGVGTLQFTEHHYLTAHNSFVLSLAEGGPVFLIAWVATFWQLFRDTASARRDLIDRPGAHEPALLAAMLSAAAAPTMLSAFFLSITYKPAFWAFFGLVPAFEATIYAKLKQEAPRARPRDTVSVIGLSAAFVVVLFLYLRMKGV